MRYMLVVISAWVLVGCDYIPGQNSQASSGCMNHANALATDAELQMMRTGNDGPSKVTLTMNNCRYYYFNPEAKTNPQGLTKDDIKACEALRAKFHAAAMQLKEQALAACLSGK